MSETADRYRKLASAFTTTVEGVPADAWSNQSPCEEWKAKDVVGHVASTTGMFFGFIGEEAPAAPSADDDPVAAWTASRDAMQAALDDPAIATKGYDGMFGPTTFEESVGRFICADLVVHRWDLARATGQDETMPIDEIRAISAEMAPMDDKMRGPGAFGAKVEPPEGADEQTAFLCFLGRQP